MTDTKFKQTEIGLIPDGWELCSVEEDCSVKARIGWQGLTKSEFLTSGDYALITGTDIVDGKINWETCVYVTKERYIQDPNIIVRKNDVLISKDGTIGKVAVVKDLPLPAVLNSGVFVLRTKTDRISQEGLGNIFLSPYFKDFIRRLTAGSTIVHLYQKDIVKFVFPVPPLEEQKRIASALSSVDELIASLDKQIAKTRDIKQGVMQQLLASPSKWRPLKEVCHALPNEAIRVTQLTEFGKYPVINSARKAIGYCDTYNNEGKSLVLTSHGEYAGYVHWLESPFFAGALCYPMRSKNENELLSKFIYYWLQNEEERIREKFVNRSGVPYVDAKAFFASSIHIPPLEEQKRIVGTLTSLDDTIEGLDAKRQKYEFVKAGMMQQLLTGAIRLD